MREENPLISENLKKIQDLSEKLSDLSMIMTNFLKYSNDLIAVFDGEGRFKFISDQWAVVLGYSKDELIGNKFMNFVHPDDKERTYDVLSGVVIEKKSVNTFINRYKSKTGSYVQLCWSSSPLVEGNIYAIARTCPLANL